MRIMGDSDVLDQARVVLEAFNHYEGERRLVTWGFGDRDRMLFWKDQYEAANREYLGMFDA